MQTVDIPTETITLADNQSGVQPDSVATHISSTSPRYSFYHYPGSDVVVFIYTCPTGSSIRERMLHASSRRNAITVAEAEGLQINKKVRNDCRSLTVAGKGANSRTTDRGFGTGRDHWRSIEGRGASGTGFGSCAGLCSPQTSRPVNQDVDDRAS